MAMQSKLWSINALSTELEIDRRTLAKRLAGLPPAESKKVGIRIEKRWRLADVVGHLKKLENRHNGNEAKTAPVNGFRMIHHSSIIHFVWWLTNEMGLAWSGAMVEAGLKKAKIKELYKLQYYLMVHYMEHYLCQDEYNKLTKEQDGYGFDELHELAHNEPISSSPPTPDEVQFEIPTIITNLYTKAERERMEKGKNPANTNK